MVVIPWMTRVDHLILEVFNQTRVPMKQRAIRVAMVEIFGAETAASETHIYRRLSVLEGDAGLLERTDGSEEGIPEGYYRLTELGERFIDDNLTEDESNRLSSIKVDRD